MRFCAGLLMGIFGLRTRMVLLEITAERPAKFLYFYANATRRIAIVPGMVFSGRATP